MLKQLIYASRAGRPMADEDLIELLRVSRERNQQHQITGMLVYKDSIFLQALEGEDGELAPIWADIQADPRHGDIVVVRCVLVEERDFADWSMGFVNMSTLDLGAMPGYSSFLEDDFSPTGLLTKPGVARDFLIDMKYCELP